MTGPYDGQLREYIFGGVNGHRTWRVTALSLAKAIRAFRVGAMYAHQYSTKPIVTEYGPSYDDRAYLSSEEGAVVPISVSVQGRWEKVAEISPEGEADEFGPALLAAQQTLQIASAAVGLGEGTTALAPAGAQAGLAQAPRREIEEKAFELQKRMAELEATKRELARQVAGMQAELQRRVEQVWMIELFLGSHEEVKCLQEGEPAPAGTPITVRQQVLCMDEEIAVHDWLHNPERIGKFDYANLDDFDNWLLADSSNLDAIFPHPKGIVGLRVRRQAKRRGGAQGYVGISGAFAALQEQEWDQMTYLLVRNGESLYRLWVDVNMWPRLFSSAKDFEPAVGRWADGRERIASRINQEEFEKKQKKFFAGLLVIQGLIERSTLFHPLPFAGLSVVRPEHQSYFNLVRDGEEHLMLVDATNKLAHLTWRVYEKWLRSQLEPGVRVLYTGPQWFGGRSDYDTMESRTGVNSVSRAPSRKEVYTLVPKGTGHRAPYRGDYQFKYLPKDEVGSWYDPQKRQKRVRWGAFSNELVPIDFISWRVLEYLLKDRNSRHEYGEFFGTAFHWWKQFKEESERERPFVDLVLVQAGADPTEENRARCERLVRWWKLKTKEHRTLGTDEAKALRMIVKAFKRGDDHDNDPEALLFQGQS